MSYRKQRVRSTIEYWVSTAETRYQARGVLPFEFNRVEVAAVCTSVQTLDADIAASSHDEQVLRRQYQDDASKMDDSARHLAGRLAQRTMLYRYLGLIETLGAGVASNAFSVSTVRELDGKRLREVWLAYTDLITRWRKANDSPDMYAGVERLANKLKPKS